MIEACIFNVRGRKLDTQFVKMCREVRLAPFSTWQYVIFKSKSGVIIEMFKR